VTVLAITLPGLPPALNHQYAYAGMRGGKRRTPEAIAWQDGATAAVRSARNEAGWTAPPRSPLTVFVVFEAPDIYRWDIDGRLKCLLDAVAAGLGHDDRWIAHLTVIKMRRAFPMTRIRVLHTEEETP
jgi:Holliday junction resolvase RusA-like endonuclease